MRKLVFHLSTYAIVSMVSVNIYSQKDVPPPPPPPPPPKVEVSKFEPPVITVKGKEADAFYKRNPSVADISRQGNIITLKLKNGEKEKYDMKKADEKKSFTGKYGASPIPPPPPPPPPKIKEKS
ncbi:MAG TPA: hypothetical protein VGQ09_22160 [Chitinophagaceae bacterium]|nr:hypothetical protein [Chitinophagaceae bacterium]